MSATKQNKLMTLTRNEALYYAKLCALVGSDAPLQVLWQVFGSRPAVPGADPQLWLVPSATVAGCLYEVNIDLGVCLCRGFYFKHACSHLKIARLAARLHLALTGAAVAA